jgi:hypothetical protein
MEKIDLTKTIRAVQEVASRECSIAVESPEIEAFLVELLWEPRNLLPAMASGLATKCEIAAALADRVLVWLVDRSGQRLSSRDWTAAAGSLEAAFHALLIDR